MSVRDEPPRSREPSLDPLPPRLTVGTKSMSRSELSSSTLLCSSLIHETGTGLTSRICCFTSKAELQMRNLIRWLPGCTVTLIAPEDLPLAEPLPCKMGSALRSSMIPFHRQTVPNPLCLPSEPMRAAPLLRHFYFVSCVPPFRFREGGRRDFFGESYEEYSDAFLGDVYTNTKQHTQKRAIEREDF